METEETRRKLENAIKTLRAQKRDSEIPWLIDAYTAKYKPQPKKESIPEKIGNFTGGTKLAQGLGQAAAMGKNSKALKESQERNIQIQGALIQRIKEKRARGEDVSRLTGALRDLGYSIAEQGISMGRILNPNQLTKKQVLGDALQLATTVASVGSYGGGAQTGKIALKKAPSVASTLIKDAGIIKGGLKGLAKGAAIGAAQGGAYGAADALKKDKTGKEVLASAGKGALLGGAIGGAVGGATGSISGGIKAKLLKNANFTEELITPKLGQKATETAIKTGRVAEGIGGKSRNYTEAIPNFNKIKESVDLVPGVSRKKTLLQNSNIIHDEIGKVAENLKMQLKGKGFFSPNEFNGYMNKIKTELIENPLMVGDAEKTAEKILNKFNSLVATKGYTPEGLLEARKGLDAWMQLQKGAGIFDPGKENAISIALRAIRQGGNNFLAEKVPDVAVKNLLSHQSNLYQAIENIAPKAAKEGESWIKRFFATRTGKVAGIVGSTAFTLGVGAVGGKVVEAATKE